MTVHSFLIGTFLAIVASWTILVMIVVWLDPTQAGPMGLALFFLALFLAVASTSAAIGYGLRRLLNPRQFPAYVVRPALRQAVWLGLLMDLLLFLQLLRLVRWWLFVIIVILFVSMEFIFLSYDISQRKNRESQD